MPLSVIQRRKGSVLSGVLGSVVAMPETFRHLIPKEGIDFIYFDPTENDKGAYFGAGRIVPPDDRGPHGEHEQQFVKIESYFDFAKPVPAVRADGQPWETDHSQNVRPIPESDYERILLEGGRSVAFIADAHLVQVLGEQLIASEKVGILELIKNAFDANARNCKVSIEKVPGLIPFSPCSDEWVASHTGPVITIADDGKGMSEEDIIQGWLRPATTFKTRVKDRLKAERARAKDAGRSEEYEALVRTLKDEHGGRLPIGEKGVGRFATQRLGRKLLICTKQRDSEVEHVLEVDWDAFDTSDGNSKDLSSVGFSLRKQDPTWDYGESRSGTLIRVFGGRDGFEWTEEKLKEVGMAIALLKSPNKKDSGFYPTFWTNHLEDSSFAPPVEVAQVPFKCEAAVDENGIADIVLTFTPPPSLKLPVQPDSREIRVDLRQKNPTYWKKENGHRSPRSGPFFVTIDCWIRTQEWIHGVNWKTLTGYLDNYGGVAIYRDGLNIVPSDTGSIKDWLQLSNAHIKKTSNLSYYNLWGSVELLQESTLDIVANTSREGLLDTVPFKDLSNLVRSITDELQLFVKGIRDDYVGMKRRAIDVAKIKERANSAQRLGSRIAERYDFSEDPMQLRDFVNPGESAEEILSGLGGTIGLLNEAIDQLEGQIEGLIEAAGFGLSIGVAVHEIEKITSSLASRIENLARDVTQSSKYFDRIKAMETMASGLRSEVRHIGPLRLTRVERRSSFGIRQAVLAAMGGFRSTWTRSEIEVPLPSRDADFIINQRFGACTQVFANLLDNATYWIRGEGEEPGARKIRIEIDPENRTVLVADSGPGIADRIREHLFEPFYSLKSPPSGLGLYICKHYMNQMTGDKNKNGEIREALPTERIEELKGAQFVIEFPHQSEVS